MKTGFALCVLIVGAGLLGGCTFPSRGTVYDRSQAGRTMNIDTGDIVAVRDVTISGDSGPIGLTGGGLVGHAAGSTVGNGAGSAIAGAVGAVGGAIVGSATEEAATRKAAQEVTLKLGDGSTILIVEATPKEGAYSVGEHVQVLQGGGGSKIRRF
jgi:outer membrane lipoprotein SlyB